MSTFECTIILNYTPIFHLVVLLAFSMSFHCFSMTVTAVTDGLNMLGMFFLFAEGKMACVCMCVQGRRMSTVVPAYRVVGGVSEVNLIWCFLAQAAVCQHCPMFLYEQDKEWHMEAMVMAYWQEAALQLHQIALSCNLKASVCFNPTS